MKIKRSFLKYIITTSLGLFIIFNFSNCESIDDTYKEFVEGGEITYVGKADSIEVLPGRERLEVTWLLLSDPKVSSYKLFWNNGSDSIMGDLVKTENVDTVRVMLNDMPEYVYNIDIFLYDKQGNSSIKSSTIGRTYGTYYESSIFNRLYKSTKRISEGLEITWNDPSEELVESELSYLDLNDKLITKIVDREVEIDTLFNIPVNGEFKYHSAYLPEPNAIDVFYTEPTVVELNK